MSAAARGRFGWCFNLSVCVVTIIPCVVANGWRVWPLFAIWTLGCSARWYYGDRQVVTDCCILGVVYAWVTRRYLSEFVVKRWTEVHTSDEVAMCNDRACLNCPTTAHNWQEQDNYTSTPDRSQMDRPVSQIKDISLPNHAYPNFPYETCF
jgi:hypothetical protein